MTREEYASKTKGFVSVVFNSSITVLPEGYMPYGLKYKNISDLLKYDKINADIYQGQFTRRIKQLTSLGYEIKEVLWQGEQKNDKTKILLALK